MANCEIESFVRKFKVLCQAGRSATLTISSDAGKASLNLCVDLGVLPEEGLQHPHHPHKRSRNGPTRHRRREKRAAARVVHAEEAEAALTLEEKEILEMAEEAAMEPIVPVKDSKEIENEKVVQAENINTKVTSTSATEVVDEVCSDLEYKEDDDKAIPKTVEVSAKLPKPPPDRSLGGRKYYTLTFDDYSDEEIY